MAAAPDLDALTRGLGRRARRACLADSVSERLQVIGLGRLVWRVTYRQPKYIPAARRSHPVGVPSAQVIAVWFDEGGEWAENRGRVSVHVGQGIDGDLLAGWPRALARVQLSTTPTRSWHPAASSAFAPDDAGA